MTLFSNLILVALGLLGLYFGGELLVTGASRIARRLGLSSLLIGLTIVAVGTSTPELFVSIWSALRGASGISLGNVIGSNIANIGLILGLTGIVATVTVHRNLVRREVPILIFVTIFTTLLMLDGELSRLDGILLLMGFIGFNGVFYWLSRRDVDDQADENLAEEETEDDVSSLGQPAFQVVGGIVLLLIGANLMVEGAANMARAVGVSETVIGLTMVAFGTSLPELATSMTAAVKKEADIAIGNIIGSNVANLLLVLGATTAIQPINISGASLTLLEPLVMIGFTVMLVPFVRNRVLATRESAMFLGAYLAFVIYSFLVSMAMPT